MRGGDRQIDALRGRCSANRSGGPIVSGKRANPYAIKYPALQAWIEMAHRPQIAALERNNIITPRLIFLDRSVPDAANHGQAKRGCVNELAPIFCGLRANSGD